MQKRSGREWRWFDQYANDVANSGVADAVRVGATNVAVENLTRIRKWMSNLPEYQQWMRGIRPNGVVERTATTLRKATVMENISNASSVDTY